METFTYMDSCFSGSIKMILVYVLSGMLILSSEAYGNYATQLESKIKGGNSGNQRSADSSVDLVYITKDGIPVCTGIKITTTSVITTAEYIFDMNNCPAGYKVHYRQPDGLMGAVGVVKGTAHEKYNADHNFSHNVGLVKTGEMMESNPSDQYERNYKRQPDPLLGMNPVHVLGWNTENLVHDETTNELNTISEIQVNIKIDNSFDHPALTLRMVTPSVTLHQVDAGCPVIFGKFVLGIISHISESSDRRIFMAKTVDFKDLFPKRTPALMRHNELPRMHRHNIRGDNNTLRH